jgi:hypothetical protein
MISGYIITFLRRISLILLGYGGMILGVPV